MRNFPIAKRPLEYVAFFNFQLNTAERIAYIFMAIDAFSQFAFQLGVEKDESNETIIKNIKLLLKDQNFLKQSKNGFTLVLDRPLEIHNEIRNFLQPKGDLLFHKAYCNHLANPFLEVFLKGLKGT